MSGGTATQPGKPGTTAGGLGFGAPGAIAGIGEQALLAGFRLAGVAVHDCESEPEVLRAWTVLPKDTAVVILTPRAAEALGKKLSDSLSPLTVVLPA